MTGTPEPISDARIAQLYSATEPQDCAMLMFHRDDVLGLIHRLRAAEARLAQVMASHPAYAIPIDEEGGGMSKPGYIIVEAKDLDHLRGYVNDAIQTGYVPVGGVHVVREYGDGGYGYHGLCIQAMVLREVMP